MVVAETVGTTHQRLWLVASLAGFLISSCQKERHGYFGTIKPKHEPNELWTNLGGEPEWIDPGKSSGSTGGQILRNIFAGLTEPHPSTMQPIPDVAQSWSISEDGRTYTFYLRESVWSDGTPLTAHDFAWSWKRLVDPTTGSKYASITYPILNAAPFNQRAIFVESKPTIAAPQLADALRIQITDHVSRIQPSEEPPGAFIYTSGTSETTEENRAHVLKQLKGLTFQVKQDAATQKVSVTAKVTDRDMVHIRAIDDHTLQVKLEQPLPFFLDLASFYVFYPAPRHVMERLQAEGKNPALWTRPENIVSNGAYVLDQWLFRRHMILKKNPNYWNAKNTKLDSIRLAMVESYNTALNLYRAGEFDWIGNNTSLPAEFMDHLSTYKDFKRYPYLGVYFYWLNTQAKPLDSVHVRKALSLAVDRRAVTEHVTRAGQIPTATLVPDGLAGYQALEYPLFDPQKAQAELTKAGYPAGKGFPELTLIYNTAEAHKQIAEAIQQMWHKHLGIDVNIENQEWKVYQKNLSLENFQIARMGWIGDYADPFTFLEVLSPHNGNNHSAWRDPAYGQMLEHANATTDRDERLKRLREAEMYMLERLPVLPIYVYTRSEVLKPYVRGFWENYQTVHLYKYMSIDERYYDGKPHPPLPDPPPPVPKMLTTTADAAAAPLKEPQN